MTLSLPLSHTEVLNRPDIDRYSVAALSGTGNGAVQLQLILQTNQNLYAFTNVSLPLVPPPLSPFENNQFILYVSQGPNNFVQQIGAIPIHSLRLIQAVPEPGTANLLLIVAVAVGSVRLLRRSE